MDYGTVTYKGQEYTLTEQATLSNRVFVGWWGEVERGEEYTAEYMAKGLDEHGEEVLITWHFDTVKGEEPEDDNYTWCDSDIVAVRYR